MAKRRTRLPLSMNVEGGATKTVVAAAVQSRLDQYLSAAKPCGPSICRKVIIMPKKYTPDVQAKAVRLVRETKARADSTLFDRPSVWVISADSFHASTDQHGAATANVHRGCRVRSA